MHAYTNIYRYISQEQIHLPDLPKHIHTYRACIYIYMYIYIHTYKYIHIGISIRFVGMHGCVYIYIYFIEFEGMLHMLQYRCRFGYTSFQVTTTKNSAATVSASS